VLGRDEIRLLVEKLLSDNGDNDPVADDESLLVSGRLQSIDAVEIVVFLEEKFGLDFAEIGFDRENIDTINAIRELASSQSREARGD
jgi:acyl carrier protein